MKHYAEQFPDFSWTWSQEKIKEILNENRVDQAKKGHVDWEGMIEEKGKIAQENYELIESLFGGKIPKIELSWSELINDKKYERLSIEEKREMYQNQPALVKLNQLRAKKKHNILTFLDLEDFQHSKEEYVAIAKRNAFTTFAVLKNGKWYERGEMGWWGIVSNEKENDDWGQQFSDMVLSLPDNTTLTLVDCHI